MVVPRARSCQQREGLAEGGGTMADLLEHAFGAVHRHGAAHAAQLAPDPVAHERELHVVLGRPQQVERQPEVPFNIACIVEGLGFDIPRILGLFSSMQA